MPPLCTSTWSCPQRVNCWIGLHLHSTSSERRRMASRRPLPTPPGPSMVNRPNQYSVPRPSDIYSLSNPYFSPYSYPPFNPHPPDLYDEPTTTLPGGTLLHKGFYDLLAMIPTPSPSRFLWGTTTPDPVLAGPRYEDLIPGPNARPSAPTISPPIKSRRISKDMVSKPTGFVYVIQCIPLCKCLTLYSG